MLFTSGEDPDWPDRLDEETGLFSYFGDNKRPGAELHATTRSGNRLLRVCFDALHGDPPQRAAIPPFLVFGKATPAGNRDVVFLGLAVPGGRVRCSPDRVRQLVHQRKLPRRKDGARNLYRSKDVEAYLLGLPSRVRHPPRRTS